MVSYSLILHIIENMLPGLHFIAPGAKLGLTNIITVLLLYSISKKDVFVVLMLRIFLGSLFGGGMSAFLYSFCGGVFSFCAMVAAKKMEKFDVSIVGVSIVGALSFNIGQLVIAGLMIQNMSIIVYFPAMAYVSLGTGTFIGLTAKFLLNRKLFYLQQME